jgi:single-strand DNA-binding protein
MFHGTLQRGVRYVDYLHLMAFELKGTVKKILDQQDFPSGFYKRDFVVTTEDQYPQDIKFSAAKERTEQLMRFREGDRVLVKFDLRGREYNGNFYVDLNAWRIEAAGEGAPVGAPAQQPSYAAAPMPAAPAVDLAGGGDDDDLPF